MKIALDARFYHKKNAFGRYSRNIVSSLAGLANEHEVTVYVLNPDHGQVPKINWREVTIPWYSWAEQIILPRILKRGHYDLVHYTHINCPIFSPQPFIVTIHDLILKRFPTRRKGIRGLFYSLKQVAYEVTLRLIVNRASYIIAVSEFTKRELISYYPRATEKIIVVSPGLEPKYLEEPKATAVDRNYFLYVGNCYPHKDLETLFHAYKQYRVQGGDKKLLMITPDDYFTSQWKNRNDINQDGVEWRHAVTDEELIALYRRAYCLLYPSRYEGFGLPLLEAMALGIPIICADIEPFRELAKTLAVYYTVGNSQQLTEAMLAMVPPSAEWQNRARAQAVTYSWDQQITKLINIYESAVK